VLVAEHGQPAALGQGFRSSCVATGGTGVCGLPLSACAATFRAPCDVDCSLLLLLWTLLPLPPAAAEPSRMPAAPYRTAFGSRCAKSPIPCNRIDYFTAHFHLADIVLLPSTDSRGFGATIGYGMSMSLFHRLEVGIGGTIIDLEPANSRTPVPKRPRTPKHQRESCSLSLGIPFPTPNSLSHSIFNSSFAFPSSTARMISAHCLP
jgi:hypothetical protein